MKEYDNFIKNLENILSKLTDKYKNLIYKFDKLNDRLENIIGKIDKINYQLENIKNNFDKFNNDLENLNCKISESKEILNKDEQKKVNFEKMNTNLYSKKHQYYYDYYSSLVSKEKTKVQEYYEWKELKKYYNSLKPSAIRQEDYENWLYDKKYTND